jgi:tRNA-(ms[2]io[6]A)-hydroxylase
MSLSIDLRYSTPEQWSSAVLNDFNAFLIDHAAAEKKASGMAMSMALHYRDKTLLVTEMIDLSIEELQHFKACVKLLHERGLKLMPDEKDLYVNSMRSFQRQAQDVGLLDRLLVAGIVEARGCERFGLVAEALAPGKLRQFYTAITQSEAKHQGLFVNLALNYFSDNLVAERLDELLDLEASLVSNLPIKSSLH